ncbi:hypothetical protein HY30_15870 [Hyphomonas chukchiensis]|uniref:Uncharacterized protein n=1 Tax=Hyphomonas chukchiensis TaxID=1280947 RepID=A0A062UN10_9PROT|nr:hypothetical protein HY30_15870 [Hyphomonas chukchiensis]
MQGEIGRKSGLSPAQGHNEHLRPHNFWTAFTQACQVILLYGAGDMITGAARARSGTHVPKLPLAGMERMRVSLEGMWIQSTWLKCKSVSAFATR